MSKKVQCVPGAHQISLDEAYWCNKCQQYLCRTHAITTAWVTTVKCRHGHEVHKAK